MFRVSSHTATHPEPENVPQMPVGTAGPQMTLDAYPARLHVGGSLPSPFCVPSSASSIMCFDEHKTLIPEFCEAFQLISQSCPNTSWQKDGDPMEIVRDFIFLGSKITADGDYSHEIKRCLFLWRKAMTNLDSVLKNRDVTLLTKVHIIKAMVSPVVMWELDHEEDWVLKNGCFRIAVLKKTLESPLDCKEI